MYFEVGRERGNWRAFIPLKSTVKQYIRGDSVSWLSLEKSITSNTAYTPPHRVSLKNFIFKVAIGNPCFMTHAHTPRLYLLHFIDVKTGIITNLFSHIFGTIKVGLWFITVFCLGGWMVMTVIMILMTMMIFFFYLYS